MSKNAIIIGASSGIGFALTKALLERSFAVGVCSRHLEPLQILQEKYSRERCLVQRMNVTEFGTSSRGQVKYREISMPGSAAAMCGHCQTSASAGVIGRRAIGSSMVSAFAVWRPAPQSVFLFSGLTLALFRVPIRDI